MVIKTKYTFNEKVKYNVKMYDNDDDDFKIKKCIGYIEKIEIEKNNSITYTIRRNSKDSFQFDHWIYENDIICLIK